MPSTLCCGCCCCATIESIRLHNAIVLIELEPGDLVEFDRGFFNHWGIYVGNQEVVHLTGNLLSSSEGYASVVSENFWDVAGSSRAYKNNSKDKQCKPLRPVRVVERAKDMVGTVPYNVIWQNCEHFAAYCRYGIKWSDQVDRALTSIVLGGAAIVIGGLLWAALSEDNKRES